MGFTNPTGRIPPLPSHETLLKDVPRGRSKWGPPPVDLVREPVGPGEESVWDYPRPPEIREADGPVEVEGAGHRLATSERALRVCETAGGPVYYIPPEDVATELLHPLGRLDVTVCEWKGAAVHYDVRTPDLIIPKAAFAYPEPLDDLGRGFARIAGWFGFYPAKVKCKVAGERVRPQIGNIYAGWITDRIKGPTKGGPGTSWW